MRVLVATDGSEDATRAVGWVARWLHDATVHLVSVAEAPPARLAPLPGLATSEPVSEVLRDLSLASATRALAQAHKRLCEAGLRPAATHLLEGEPARGIVDLARGVEADVIVLGHHRRGCLGRLWHGSVSGQVQRAWPGAVLLVGRALSAPVAVA
jgi:nucleotide-binding universal stress UspA family protein